SFYFYENAYKEGVVYLPENSPEVITEIIDSSWKSLFNGGLRVHAPITGFVAPSGWEGYHCIIEPEADQDSASASPASLLGRAEKTISWCHDPETKLIIMKERTVMF